MADTFVKMVEFRATGLDEIKSKLDTVNQVQSKLTGSVKQYRVAVGDSVRQLRQQERLISSGVFQRRLRQTQELMKAQERLNRMIEKEKMIAKYGSIGGRAAFYGGGAARAGMGAIGGVAAAGLAAGVAGLRGTVPMARLESQSNRVAYELGNTLTPVVDRLSAAMQKFANWLERRPEYQQNAIGGALAVGGGLAALRATTGIGVGTLARGGIAAGSYAMGAGRAAIGAAGQLPLGTMARGAGRFAWPIAAAAAAGSAVRTKYNIEASQSLEDRLAKGDLSGTEDIARGYQSKFAGLGDKERKEAIKKELDLANKLEAAGIAKTAGPNSGTMLGRLYDQAFYKNSSTELTDEARQRQAVLRNMMGGGSGMNPTDHRKNAYVGGQFQALGTGYDTAYEGLAKSGMNFAEEQANNIAQMNEKMGQLLEAANEMRAQQGLPPLQRP